MNRKFRLTRSIDIKRVRRSGKSYAHPLVVLYAIKSDAPVTRIGVSAGLAVGNAVQRNRAKRLLRAAINGFIEMLNPGWTILLIARSPLPASTINQARAALSKLLKRADLISQAHDI